MSFSHPRELVHRHVYYTHQTLALDKSPLFSPLPEGLLWLLKYSYKETEGLMKANGIEMCYVTTVVEGEQQEDRYLVVVICNLYRLMPPNPTRLYL